MAYRQLGALAFVMLGWAGAACGGETGSGPAVPETADEAPGSPDGAPPSADGAPPSSTEAPPVSADGDQLQQLCEEACDVFAAIADCPGAMAEFDGRSLCEDNACATAAAPAGPVPCLNEIEGLFRCVASLPDICMPSEEQAAQCLDEVESFSGCVGSVEPGDTNGEPSTPNPSGICQPDTCNDCPTACTECTCENADLGADVLEACAEECGLADQ